MTSVLQDFRYALRFLRSNPSFTAVAVMTLALGIGANTTIFLLINAILLRRLPFRDQDRLVVVDAVDRGDRLIEAVSFPDFVDWRVRSTSFEGIEAYSSVSATLSGVMEPEHLEGVEISARFLPFFGIGPALGRNFLGEEDTPNGDRVLILSHGIWVRAFDQDASVIGRSIALDVLDQRRTYTVVGVMPAGAALPLWMSRFDVLTPLGQTHDDLKTNRGVRAVGVVGRLRPGVSLDQSNAELRSIAASLEREHPDTNQGFSAAVMPLRVAMVGRVMRKSLLVLAGAVGFVLLIACANLANLLLARATAREREFAVRLAIGAGRWRIVRQLLVESCVLAVAGGALGLLLAFWLRDLLVALVPTWYTDTGPIGIDWRVFTFTGGIAASTALVFGLAPAIQSSGLKPHHSLKSGTSSPAMSGGRRLRSVLVSLEIALTLVLLVAAGLMINSLARLERVDLGLPTERLSIARLELPYTTYRTRAAAERFYQDLLQRVGSLAAVDSASLSSFSPLLPTSSAEVATAGASRSVPSVHRECITPEYFRTVGVSLLAGREFTERDTGEGSGAVAIINRHLAMRLLAGQTPIGHRIMVSYGEPLPFEVVGIVADTKRGGRARQPMPEVYIPAKGRWLSNLMTLVVRSHADSVVLAPQVREHIRSLDKNLPVPPLRPVTDYLDTIEQPRRLAATLIVSFAALAIGLSVVGIYGVMSYVVTRRNHEIGVRIALGAEYGHIVRLILRQSMATTLVGLVFGFGGAVAVTRLLQAWLFEVTPTDPLTFCAAASTLVAVAAAAAYVPARRAAHLDPVAAIREE